jgi:hypothetical protein
MLKFSCWCCFTHLVIFWGCIANVTFENGHNTTCSKNTKKMLWPKIGKIVADMTLDYFKEIWKSAFLCFILLNLFSNNQICNYIFVLIHLLDTFFAQTKTEDLCLDSRLDLFAIQFKRKWDFFLPQTQKERTIQIEQEELSWPQDRIPRLLHLRSSVSN